MLIHRLMSLKPIIPTPEEVASLTPDERAIRAAAYLGGLEKGRQPEVLFKELVRLMVISTVELVPLRRNPARGNTEVLLGQRSATESYWPRMWHIPGVVVLASDTVEHRHDFDGSVGRILDNELQGRLKVVGEVSILEVQRRRMEERGDEVTVVHWAEVSNETRVLPPGHQFFDVAGILRQPPESGIVDGHTALIERAAAAYDIAGYMQV